MLADDAGGRLLAESDLRAHVERSLESINEVVR
jgi:hypothetical protein